MQCTWGTNRLHCGHKYHDRRKWSFYSELVKQCNKLFITSSCNSMLGSLAATYNFYLIQANL